MINDNVAGIFYPIDKDELLMQLDALLDNVKSEKELSHISTIQVPHANYVYSGETAAYAYKQLESKQYKTVIIIGVSHQIIFDGIAIYKEPTFETPLGKIKIDVDYSNNLRKSFEFSEDIGTELFLIEHSIEVQIPFIQSVLPDAKIVMLMVSETNRDSLNNLAKVLANNHSNETLLVASSDLSHYHLEEIAREKDSVTIDSILKTNAEDFYNQKENLELCGKLSVYILLKFSEQLNLKSKLLFYDTSSSGSGDSLSVVGYSSIIFFNQ